MSSTAYHWSPRLVESGEGVETVDPWLDDKTTIPYRRGSARSSTAESTARTSDTQPEAARAPLPAKTLPPRPVRPTLPASYVSVPASSTRAIPASPAATASTRSQRPYFSPPAVIKPPKASVIPLQRAAAVTSTGQHRRPVPTVRVARPVQPRKRQPTTMKLERLPTRPALTTGQVAHDALESYWRTQERAVRGPNTRLYIGAAVGAALLVAVALRLFAPELLPSLPWQRAPSVNLADLMTREHATAQAAAAPSDIRPSTNVMVTAPGSDTLVQPATLQIDSQPWARVIVDDVLIGNTPQLAIKLQPGKHVVQLRNPELNLRKDIPIEAHAGETIHRVEQLEP